MYNFIKLNPLKILWLQKMDFEQFFMAVNTSCGNFCACIFNLPIIFYLKYPVFSVFVTQLIYLVTEFVFETMFKVE